MNYLLKKLLQSAPWKVASRTAQNPKSLKELLSCAPWIKTFQARGRTFLLLGDRLIWGNGEYHTQILSQHTNIDVEICDYLVPLFPRGAGYYDAWYKRHTIEASPELQPMANDIVRRMGGQADQIDYTVGHYRVRPQDDPMIIRNLSQNMFSGGEILVQFLQTYLPETYKTLMAEVNYAGAA